jgi:hypothetical protein
MRRRQTVLLAIVVAAALEMSALAQEAPNSGKPKRPSIPAQPLKAESPNTYGTTHSSFYRMGSSEFTPLDVPGTDDYSDMYYNTLGASYRRYGTIANAYFIGTPHLPSGAKVISIYVNGCADASGTLFGGVSSCNYFGNCTLIAPYAGAPGCGSDYIDLTSAGYVVDNSRYGAQLVIRLATAATDGSDSFSGVTIEYQLQVSTAPAMATFPDVPTSDFGFQYVEALVASGITGGCGGGNYCPDSPVTRRQMAIFISKALGLHFP